MADTNILPAVNAAIESVRGEVQSGFKHLNDRLDKLHDGNVETAKWMGQQEQKVTAAHRRIDEVREEVMENKKAAEEARGPGWKGWAGIVAATLAGIAGIVAAWRGNTMQAQDRSATRDSQGTGTK